MKTLVNPRGDAVRLVFSDGSERQVSAWGIALVPEHDAAGRPLTVVRTELTAAIAERRAA